MSTISAGNTTTTAFKVTADLTGNVIVSTTGGMIFTNSSTGGLTVPTGTDAQRPSSPPAGTIRYNTSNNNTEIYTGLTWSTITSQTYSVNYLVAGGGGGGGGSPGGYAGGGGGAGGYLANTTTLTGGVGYAVTIGAGGTNPGTSAANGANGTSSSLGAIATALGGGGGGSGASSGQGNNGVAGASGGGGGGGPSTGSTGGAGTSGQGYAGGNGANAGNSGGGGGAGGVGGAASSGAYGTAGPGANSTISGSTVTYCTGGAAGGSAPANSGNGGIFGSGASGIVIISYAGTQRGTGGTVTSSGGNTIHTFTTSGTYTA